MKFNYARVGQIVIDKITLKKLTVVEVSEDKALLVEKDKLGNPTEFSAVLTKDNAICFRLFDDPNPLDIPGGDYTADEGILFSDAEPVTENQGEIYVLDVLGKIRGAVVLTTRTSGSEDLIDLMTYEPFHDKFNCLKRGLENGLSFITSFEDIGVVNYLYTEKKTVKDEKENDVEIVVASGFEVFVIGRRTITDTLNVPFVPDEGDIQTVNEKLFIGGDVLVLTDKRTDGEITGREHSYLAVNANQVTQISAGKSIITKSLKYGYVFKGNDVMKFDDGTMVNTSKLAQTSGYPYLVDITEKNGTTVFTFADSERNTIRLIRKVTRDRGYCYSIEE